MKLEDVKAIVSANLAPLQQRLGLLHYKFRTSFDLSDTRWDEFAGCAVQRKSLGTINPDDDRAHIAFDPSQFEAEGDVLATLRDELFRVVASPFHLFATTVLMVHGPDTPQWRMLDKIKYYAEGQLVISLRRMYAGMTTGPIPETPPKTPFTGTDEFIKIVRRHAKPLMKVLGVGHWEIGMAFDYDEENAGARITRAVDYDHADIHFNPGIHRDEAQVFETLRHELLHVVAAPLYMFASVTYPYIRAKGVWGYTETLHQHVEERMVVNLERMYDRMAEPAKPKKKRGSQ